MHFFCFSCVCSKSEAVADVCEQVAYEHIAWHAQSATAPKVIFQVAFLSRKSMENIVMCVHIALRGSLESSESLWVVAWMSF